MGLCALTITMIEMTLRIIYNNYMKNSDLLDTLKSKQSLLQRLGVDHLCIYGSWARGENTAESDLDVYLSLNPKAGVGLLKLARIQKTLAECIEQPLDIQLAPVKNPQLRKNIESEGIYVF